MWIQQKNLRLCLLPDNCRTTLSKATASLWAWEQTASSSFCASSSPALGSWVKWSWPRRSQFSAASVNCCDQPVAQTQLSSWPWKSQWCSRRLSLAIEFSCTASKSCKEKSWHCQFIFSSESPWAEKFPSLDVPLETADAESIECIRSPLSLQGCCLFSCAVWRIWKATSCMLPVARYPELAGCVLWLQYPVCSRDMWLQEMRG